MSDFFDVSDLRKLVNDIREVAEIPAAIRRQAVRAKAKIDSEAIRKHAQSDLQGPYYQGQVAGSIKLGRARATKADAVCDVKFMGVLHAKDARAGEVAFINEYGKKGQPARPFIKMASKEAAPDSNKAAADVIWPWFEKHNL